MESRRAPHDDQLFKSTFEQLLELPLVLPVVVYQGPTPWNAPLR